MKKTVLAIALGAIATSGAAFAETETKVYGSAEIGGNFNLDDQVINEKGEEVAFSNSHEIEVGAEISKKVQKDVSVFVAAEAEYEFGGEDLDVFENETFMNNGEAVERGAKINTFVIGADTKAGRTTLGIQAGIADDFEGFADLSMEHGLGDYGFAPAVGGEETLQHVATFGAVSGGVSYDFETEAYAVAGQIALPKGLTLGGAYVEGEKTSAYTLGAVMSVKQIDLAAKYSVNEHDNGVDGDAYAISGAYALNNKVKFAGSYNVEGDDYVMAGSEEDDYFTVGASYQLTKSVELVTDYKFASESDDQLFVRANVQF